jgi:uncharacterized membrane protein YciS (DUF1049 family)
VLADAGRQSELVVAKVRVAVTVLLLLVPLSNVFTRPRVTEHRVGMAVTLAALLAALVVYAVLSNSEEVIVNLPLIQWPTKLWAAMVASAIVGAALASLVLAWPLTRAKLATRRQTRRIAQLEQEVHGLRTLPIASDPATSTSPQKV